MLDHFSNILWRGQVDITFLCHHDTSEGHRLSRNDQANEWAVGFTLLVRQKKTSKRALSIVPGEALKTFLLLFNVIPKTLKCAEVKNHAAARELHQARHQRHLNKNEGLQTESALCQQFLGETMGR